MKNSIEKLRAVIYNRCSTEEESQKDALIKQVQESKNCVYEQGWALTDTYIEAKSGTTVKGRNEYNRLYQDLELDKFDIIVIKSQDRLMRNTKDWYLFLDRMQRNRKRLFMYLEHKFYTPDDALISGIKAILAEEYSRELSKKINNAHKNRQKEGKRFVFTNQTYGLKKLPDKSIVVDEGEAEMIRMIFQLSASGCGTHCSAEILYRNGYRNHNGKSLSPSVIRNIIRNPLYKGTVVQNRLHHDFESKQTLRNPLSEWIVHENVLPAIVDPNLFERANREMDARRQDVSRDNIFEKENPPGKYDFSGKIFCGHCGCPFYRTVRKNKSGRITEWKCSNYLQNGRMKSEMRREKMRKAEKDENTGCDNIHLNEKRLYTMLQDLCVKKYHGLEKRQNKLLDETTAVFRRAFGAGNSTVQKQGLQASLDKIIRQKSVLLEKLLDGILPDTDFKIKNQELEERKQELEEKLRVLEDNTLQSVQLESRIASLRNILENGVIERAQTVNMLENVIKIEVFPAYLEIYFTSWTAAELLEDNTSVFVRRKTDKLTIIRIPQKCSTSPVSIIEEEKMAVLAMMRKKPQITAREIAEQMEVNLSRINSRIRELKKEEKIRYSTPNGRGRWQILAPFPDRP